MQNALVYYQGEQSLGLWAKEPIILKSANEQRDDQGHYLREGQQMEQQLCVNYNRIPYEVISGRFVFQNEQTVNSCEFILPCLLTKFMQIRDVDKEVFESKWFYKSKSILKSDLVPINPKIISKHQAIDDYFQNELLDLTETTELEENVVIEKGCLFTLNSPNIEFMLKIIVFPNMNILFQIIPYASYSIQAEHILHTLVFIFGLPD